jgi:hypothetical protein
MSPEEMLARARVARETLADPPQRDPPHAPDNGSGGPRPFAPIGEDRDPPQENEAPRPRVICPAIFKGRTPPPRRWIAPQWIPYEVVTGLYGDGGVGKSLLSQQLQTGTALGSSRLGLPVEQVASLGVYCEDSESELWRRQEDINVAYSVEDQDVLALAHWMPASVKTTSS